MKKVEKVNGKYVLNCIILTEGVLPAFAGIRGPLLIPRPMDVEFVKTLLYFNVDVRVVDGMEYELADAEKLTVEKINELITGKKPEQPQVKEEPKVEVPPVKEEPVIEEVKEEPPVVEQPVQEEVKEEVKSEKPAQNNKKNKK